MNKLTIRQAAIQDLSKLVPIFDDYREYFGQQKNPAQVEQFLFEKFEHLESVIFISQLQDEVVGFAQLYPVFSSLTLQRIWLLNDFFINEEFRGSGVGTQLFAEGRNLLY
ncbi:GNAT family N-acetyltransferase [Neobacillus sp. 3P2-tot-E-2]|uniref:GNAT family N-acetyltransferase n=1 Tax=Neobacillus sp. 3P2-tot-E-2 TaxID=3132212 RepID=UPI00399F15B0